MKLLYAVFTERLRATASGQFIIEGTAEFVTAWVDPPYRLPQIYLAGIVIAEPPVDQLHTFELLLFDPETGELALHMKPYPNFVLEPIAGNPSAPHFGRFGFLLPSLAYPNVGVYEFQIQIDGKLIGKVPLYIVREPPGGRRREAPPSVPAQGLAIEELPPEESVAAVLYQARERLRYARVLGEELLRHPDPARAAAGFSNVIVWGRAVTNALDRLKNRAPGFQAWYTPWKREMEGDPLMKYIYSLRTPILKEGEALPVTSAVDVRKMREQRIPLPPPPPEAIGFFMADETGGVGWLVRMPDGAVGKIYATIPEGASPNTLEVMGLPERHLGAPIMERTAEHVASLYLHYLERLVSTAEQLFGPGKDGPEKITPSS